MAPGSLLERDSEGWQQRCRGGVCAGSPLVRGPQRLQFVPVRSPDLPLDLTAVSYLAERRRGSEDSTRGPNEVVVQRLFQVKGRRVVWCHGGACGLGGFQLAVTASSWTLGNVSPAPPCPFSGALGAPRLDLGRVGSSMNSMKTQWGGSRGTGPCAVCVSQRHPPSGGDAWCMELRLAHPHAHRPVGISRWTYTVPLTC